jgi:hypothetical protein
MAQSGLSSALKPSGGLLLNPEDDNYQTALERIRTALDARENRPFDPHLLAIAQGLLSPTKTGSFGESLGQAAGNVFPVMQAEEKADMENAQMRLQLAQAEREQSNLTAAQRAFQQKAGLPVTGARPGAPGAPGAPGSPAQGGAPEMKTVSLQDAMEFVAAFPNQKELGARMMEAAKAGLDRYSIAMNGIVFDKMAGKYLNADIPGQTQSDFSTPYGTFKMTPNQHARFEMAQNIGMGREWMDAFKQGNQFKIDQLVAGKLEGKPMPPEAPTKPVVSGAPMSPNAAAPVVSNEPNTGRLTVSEQEAAAAAAKERATVMAKSEAERTNLVLDAAKGARGAQATYNRADEILKTPGIDKVMGLVNKGDVVSGITNLVTDSLKVGNYTVGIPAIKKILTDSGIPQNVLDKALELAQLEAMWQMESRKGLGAGTSVSNMEQQMANRITPSQDDPMGAYKQKLAFLQEKGKFDIQLARELKRSKMTYDQFEDTDAFDSIFKDYQNRLMNITTGAKTTTNKPNTSTAQTGPITADSLRGRLNPQKPQ